MKIVTHSGHFHADDILAVATLLLKFPEAEVVRSRAEKEIEAADIVVDVGQIYDPQKLKFDHHQKSGAGERPNGVPYASFGLVWREFGEELAGGKEEAKVIEEKLVMPVDARDNGIDPCSSKFDGVKEYAIGDYFETFNYEAGDMEGYDRGFFKALSIATELLRSEIGSARRSVEDWQKVRRIFEASEDKRIVVLEKDLHWKRVLIPTEALYVVHERPDGYWAVRAVPKNIAGYEVKKPLPTSWAGLDADLLPGVSGVADAFFCHRDLWLAVAKSQKGAIALANKALNA